MAKKMGTRLMLSVTVDLDDWELAYGKGDDKESIKAHISDTVEELVREQFVRQANGSELVSVTIWRA